MKIALLVMTDGRDDLLARTLASANSALVGPLSRLVIHDDTGDLVHRGHLREILHDAHLKHPSCEVIGGPDRRGFGGAYANAWTYMAGLDVDFVFGLEDDFTFNRLVDLAAMAGVLDEHPNLVQLALRRQPWNAEERAAGGIVEQHPDDYTDRADRHGHEWLEHRKFFTTNPSLYRRSLCERGWPQVEFSEGTFTHQLLADPAVKFAFWGARGSGEAVTHIGVERAGVGY